MNIYGTPALISSVLTTSLALVAWVHRRHDRRNIALALFAFNLALLSIGNFGLTQCSTLARAEVWYHFPLSVLPLLIGATWYYMLVLTGHDRRLSQRVLGMPLWVYLILGGSYVVTLSALMQTTDLLFDEIRPGAFGGYYLHHTDEIGLYFLGVPLFFVLFLVLFTRALRQAPTGPYRKYLMLNAAGLVFMILSTPLIGAVTHHIMPEAGYFVFIGPSIACLILYFALVSFQFDQVRDLNLDLEAKVQQRTLHLRRAQAHLVQSQKMASLGRLVAGLAHEFNTPIGAVLSTSASGRGWVNKLERALARQPPDPAHLERILLRLRQSQDVISEGAERVASIVQRMTAFARLDQAERKPADLGQCVDEAIGLLPHGWDREITLERELPSGLPLVECFPARLNQALLCLLQNAVDAMDGSGLLTIKLCVVEPWAEIAIGDTGRGIPEELLEQIFDPGFTTKSRGVGTGLGLSVAYQVMADHHGEVDVASEPDRGTTVTLRLPLDLERRLAESMFSRIAAK